MGLKNLKGIGILFNTEKYFQVVSITWNAMAYYCTFHVNFYIAFARPKFHSNPHSTINENLYYLHILTYYNSMTKKNYTSLWILSAIGFNITKKQTLRSEQEEQLL